MAAEATNVLWTAGTAGGAQQRRFVLHRRALLAPLLTCIGYYMGSQIGFALTFRPHPVSVLWPPNSILLAALLLTPTRSWGFVLLGALPAHCLVQLQTHTPVSMMICYFISNSCEALIGAACTRYFVRGQLRFDTLRSTAVFCLCGALLAPFLSSFLDAGFVRLNHWGAGAYWELWRIRFFSNVLAALTFASAIVTWLAPRSRGSVRWNRNAFIETALLLLGLAVASYAAFYAEGPSAGPVLFLAPLPFLLWAALRVGPRGTTSAILMITFLSIWSASHGHGPFAGDAPEQNARSLQMFLVVMAIPFLFLTAVTEERKSAEELFGKAFRSNPDPMWIARLPDAKLFDINEQWEKLFGHRREEAIGRTVFDLELWADVEDRAEIVLRVGLGPVRDYEVSFRSKEGELIPVSLSTDIVQIQGEDSLVIIVRDMRDRKRAEQADRRLAHATRVAVLGELTASIAHEINQPLGAILSNADAAEMLLEGDTPPIDELRRIVSDIRDDDLRASETIQHIRMLTSKRTPTLERLDLHELIHDVVRLVSGDARRRAISLETELSAIASEVRGDRVALQQLLMNLILNGMEAMADTQPRQRRIVIAATRHGNEQVEVSVRDTGHGLPADKFPRLFETFFTTREDGVGLGLSIAKSIVRAHHGSISAENDPNGGAILRFVLPLWDGAEIAL